MKIKRLLCTLLLSLAIFTFCSLFMVIAAGDGIVSVNAGKEALNATFNKIAGATSYNAYYKNENDTNYTKIDDELVREIDNNIRVDAVGLEAGNYYLKLVPIINSQENDSQRIEIKDITVSKEDRSGYAHFNYTSGVGAYTDDGVLKDNTVVVYVTDATKNTVKATIAGLECVGLANILAAQKNSNNPLDIRIIGEIQTVQWNKVTYTNDAKTSALVTEQAALVGASATTDADNITGVSYSNDLSRGITKLNGLKSQAIYKDGKFDSYWNMLEFDSARNVTIEGIGDDAGIYQFGFTVKKSNSIEFKNLYFTDYPEDAIGIQGNKNTDLDYSNYWLHNLTFNEGLNNWDLSYEQDKGDGDGSSDFKYAHNLTISYCKYNGTHKTNLIGSGNDCLQYNITLHHNYYLGCKSRLPLLRQANCHMYNNYYKDTTSTGISVRAYAFAFVENCYFDAKNPYMLAYEVKDNVNPVGTTIKAIGNVFTSKATTSDSSSNGLGINENGIFVLTGSGSNKSYSSRPIENRTTKSGGSTCYPDGTTTDYTNFDTNESLFYYDKDNECSIVEVMNNASELPELIPTVAGAGISKAAEYTVISEETDLPPVYNNTSVATVVNDDFSSNTDREINTTSNTPSDGGIYKNLGSSTTNNVTITNSQLYIYDDDANTVEAYYMFYSSSKFTTGKVLYQVSVTIPSAGNWKFLTFLGDNGNCIVGSSETNKKLGYYDTTWHEMFDTQYAANSTHVITLIVDYDNSSAVLNIDGTSANVSCKGTINGLKFVTAGNASRSFYVNSVSVTVEDELKLGYQLGKYTVDNTEYKALRIIGKLQYNEVYDSVDDIDNVVINITIKNSSGVTTKTINAEVETFYKSLKLSDNTVVAESGEGIRYYYTVIKGITSAHKGYTINATTTITLKNGTVVECSGFSYEI
ncbi:MAG: hypothetical protein IJM36_04815 [Acholeplasmatales bacterium]|nr:hypothetical protein [Acholeplasmatales bacterium]